MGAFQDTDGRRIPLMTMLVTTTNRRALSGKTVLVTGAAKRLGRAIALAAAENGADVAITYRESAREAQAAIVELARMARKPSPCAAMSRMEARPGNGEGSGERTGRDRRAGE